MLEAFIVDELRRKREQARQQQERPQLELPLPSNREEDSRPKPDYHYREEGQPEDTSRGVAYIDFNIDTP